LNSDEPEIYHMAEQEKVTSKTEKSTKKKKKAPDTSYERN
jgi:hypothetical protein